MKKQLLYIPALLIIGVLVGVFMMKAQQQEVPVMDAEVSQPVTDSIRSSATQSPFNVIEPNQLDALSAKILELQVRIELLETESKREHESSNNSNPSDDDHETDFSSVVDTPITSSTRVLIAKNLIKAGIDPSMAADIVRRKNELELRKLEVRDRAARENYLGTKRHMRELNEITENESSLRDELGDDAYDRYLFTSGQANRVRVASVMLGSAAEQSGMKTGDLIMHYGELRLFDWEELQHATTQGDRSDYVSIMAMRDGVEIMMWVPRGPLGVRLTSMRVNPDKL